MIVCALSFKVNQNYGFRKKSFLPRIRPWIPCRQRSSTAPTDSLSWRTASLSAPYKNDSSLFTRQNFERKIILLKQNRKICFLHRKKSFSIFPSPAGMSLTKLSPGGNNLYMTSLFPPSESLVSDIPARGTNIEKLSLRCIPISITVRWVWLSFF